MNSESTLADDVTIAATLNEDFFMNDNPTTPTQHAEVEDGSNQSQTDVVSGVLNRSISATPTSQFGNSSASTFCFH